MDPFIYGADTNSSSRIFSGRLSYNKGALVLRMLNWIIGDSLFFKTLRNYLNDKGLAYDYATTPDLLEHFNTTTGKDFTEFFNDWIYKEGYPSYRIVWYQDVAGVHINLSQTAS